ncbi:transposase family protein [Streptomyces sp. NPDC056069]|uniref:transposase family protein n=1 Tax=Streptomyces sp. NPDC056069 TaxID=3345702 RepID=UPI0035DEF95B
MWPPRPPLAATCSVHQSRHLKHRAPRQLPPRTGHIRRHRPRLRPGRRPAPVRPGAGSPAGPARGRCGLRPARRDTRRVRPRRRQPGRLHPEAPPSRRERAGHRRPTGNLLWISPALPSRTHDLTAARTHRTIRIRERQGAPVLADRTCTGAGPRGDHTDQTPPEPRTHPNPADDQPALSAARAPVEQSVARLKSWRIFHKARCSPNRMTAIAAAVPTLEHQR